MYLVIILINTLSYFSFLYFLKSCSSLMFVTHLKFIFVIVPYYKMLQEMKVKYPGEVRLWPEAAQLSSTDKVTGLHFKNLLLQIFFFFLSLGIHELDKEWVFTFCFWWYSLFQLDQAVKYETFNIQCKVPMTSQN